jgi:hypothetical protein
LPSLDERGVGDYRKRGGCGSNRRRLKQPAPHRIHVCRTPIATNGAMHPEVQKSSRHRAGHPQGDSRPPPFAEVILREPCPDPSDVQGEAAEDQQSCQREKDTEQTAPYRVCHAPQPPDGGAAERQLEDEKTCERNLDGPVYHTGTSFLRRR